MWFFVSDLHGRVDRYQKLFDVAARQRPSAILLGGDLLPSGLTRMSTPAGAMERARAPRDEPAAAGGNFISDFLAPSSRRFATASVPPAPRDLPDPRQRRPARGGGRHSRRRIRRLVGIRRALGSACEKVSVFRYACVPPTPFLLKDWERYDVPRFVDPGCVSPEEGRRSVAVAAHEIRYTTIQDDLNHLAGDGSLDQTIWLFHAPPHDSVLDRAALDGVMVDHAPVDVHVGSIAIRRFIEARHPLITLHGHIHESARLTGCWRQQFGRTWAFLAADDGPELALIRFDPRNPATATRTRSDRN